MNTIAAACVLVRRLERRLRELRLFGLTLWTGALERLLERAERSAANIRRDLGRVHYLADSAIGALDAAMADGVVTLDEARRVRDIAGQLSLKLVELEAAS